MPPETDSSVEFAKLSGSGNDFICIDNRDGRYDGLTSRGEELAAFVRACCRRGLGVGADGIIFVAPAGPGSPADVIARHFEPDGSEAELCGNGVACLTRWVIENGWVWGPEVRLLTGAGVVQGRQLDDGYIRACIPLPAGVETDIELIAQGRTWWCDYAIVGTPHAVTFVENVDRLDLPRWGPAIRHHPRLAPRGANANFVQVLGEGRLSLRTWESGVEGETLACGTGSAAAALLAARRFRWPRRFTQGEAIEVLARSGQMLRVFVVIQDDGRISDLCIDTHVQFIYRGRLHEEWAPGARLRATGSGLQASG